MTEIIKNTKQVTITLPVDLLELLRVMKTDNSGKYAGRTTSNLCAFLITERLQQLKKENLTHLLD